MVRDYSLIGVESQKVIEMGLTDADWYQSPVPREKMRELLQRKNGPAIRDTVIWFGLLLGSGYLVFIWWGSWFFILPYVIYSVLYASTSDSRWHETLHGTAFRSDWMNNVLYEIASFMVFRQSTVWRWSHTRHHSDTIIRGRDPEIAVPKPPRIGNILLGFIGIRGSIPEIRRIFLHASGKIDPEVATYLPEYEYKKVIFKARIYIAIYLTVIGLSIYSWSILPLMFIGLPVIFGSWLMPVYGLTQHAGLQENVLDHRLNCRTVYMNRINRYLYWNMNYHVEHHMFPLVPYHALPELHELVKDDCPTPYSSIIDAFREIIPTVLRQVKEPAYCVERVLPPKASGAKTSGSDKRIFSGNPATINQGKIEVCRLEELQPGDVVRFDYQQKTYAVYRTVDNSLYATDGICTHGNTHLSEGVIIGDIIECSKHNGRFSLIDGSPKRNPACVALRTYKIEPEKDKVMLDLSGIGIIQQAEANERTFRVAANRNVATYIKELELEPLKGEEFAFHPGQYIQLVIPPHKTVFSDFRVDEPHGKIWKELNLFELSGESVVYSKRNYSIAANPDKEINLKFNIRIALPPEGNIRSAGAGSSYVFGLKEGDNVKLCGPFGDFLIKKSDREMIYLGGGAGMAPIRSHLSYLFETEYTTRKVSYWYGARTLNDLFYKEYFEELEQLHSNFSFHVSLSEINQSEVWNGYKGFVHQHLFENYLHGHPQPGEIEYYLCGPPPMIKASLKMLEDLGVKEDHILFDEF